jgi:hypothetical protein
MKPSRLFHFTDHGSLEFIRSEGLKPHADLWYLPGIGMAFPPDFPVVWLTTDERRCAISTGPDGMARITVELSPKDRRLHHWERWAKRHEPDFLAELNAFDPFDVTEGFGEHWFYTGIITPDKFTAIDVDPRDPR